MGAVVVEVLDERVELALLLQEVLGRGFGRFELSVRCMRSCRPFCSGCAGLMRSIPIPRRNHQTESFERPKNEFGLAKGTPLSVRIASGSPKSLKTRSNTVNA